MSLVFLVVVFVFRSFPRVSGDEPAVHQAQHLLAEFSPRERG